MNVLVQQPGTVQLTQQRGDTARTVHMLNVILRRVRCNLRQTGHMARNTVDIVQREVSAGLMRNSQGVQHGIGRTAHSHIQRHSVLEGFLGGDRTGQNGLVILLIVALRQANDALTRLQKQLFTRDLGRKRGTVAGQRQTDRLVQAVHGVCGKHTRAGTTRRAGVLLNLGERGIAHGIVYRHDHRIHQIQAVLHNAFNALAGFHRAARNENCGDIQAHRRQEHTGGDLVAVRDTYERIRAVSVHHVFDRVGNEVA